MILDETEVIKLYTYEQFSVMHIAKSFSVSWRQIENILEKHKISRRTISEAITAHNISTYGLKQFSLRKDLSHEDELLKVAGVMLYSGEGSKRGGSVALSNSNPAIIAVFMKFLRHICGIAEDRIHITVHLYEDHNPEFVTAFWSNVTNVPSSQFYKPYLHKRSKGTYRSPSKYGTISVQYSDKKLHSLIISWIDEYHQSLLV